MNLINYVVSLELEQACSNFKRVCTKVRKLLQACSNFRSSIKGAHQYYRPVLIPSRDVRGTQSQKMWYNKLLNRIQSFLYLHNLPTISIY